MTLNGNAGSFTLTHQENNVTITFPLAQGQDLAAEIQSKLEGLDSIDAGDIQVTSTTTQGVFDIQFNNPISPLIAVGASGLLQQTPGSVSYDEPTTTLTINGNAGSFTLTNDGTDVLISASEVTTAADLQAVLRQRVPRFGPNKVRVAAGARAGEFILAFSPSVKQTSIDVDDTGLFVETSGTGSYTQLSSALLDVSDGDAGSFELTHEGNTTTITAAQANEGGILAALHGLDSLEVGDVSVSPTVTPNVFEIQFVDDAISPLIEIDDADFVFETAGTVSYQREGLLRLSGGLGGSFTLNSQVVSAAGYRTQDSNGAARAWRRRRRGSE